MIDKELVSIATSKFEGMIEIHLPGYYMVRRIESILPEGWEDYGGMSDPFLHNPALVGNCIIACSEMGGSPVEVVSDLKAYLAAHISCSRSDGLDEYGQDWPSYTLDV